MLNGLLLLLGNPEFCLSYYRNVDCSLSPLVHQQFVPLWAVLYNMFFVVHVHVVFQWIFLSVGQISLSFWDCSFSHNCTMYRYVEFWKKEKQKSIKSTCMGLKTLFKNIWSNFVITVQAMYSSTQQSTLFCCDLTNAEFLV